jgi:hypothetical protein
MPNALFARISTVKFSSQCSMEKTTHAYFILIFYRHHLILLVADATCTKCCVAIQHARSVAGHIRERAVTDNFGTGPQSFMLPAPKMVQQV